jgi:hypothetical protein
MNKEAMKVLNIVVCGALVFQLAGCGTILYPERKGQRDGRIDVGVAILDGIGLFFFLIPGIIAYAVDFSNGTIYLPAHLGSANPNDLKQVKFDLKHFSVAKLEKIITNETGHTVTIDSHHTLLVRMQSKEDMMEHFAQALPEIQNAKVALLNKE